MEAIDRYGPRETVFRDRLDVGYRLAERLAVYRDEEPIVLGLPRGGVPVAAVIARSLEAPLDVLVARKVGAPGQEELALGAVAPGGVQVFDANLVRLLDLPTETCYALADDARREMANRIRRFRGEGAAELPDVRDRTVILVDDGLATGATALAAIRAVRTGRPRRVVLAVGVGPPETVAALRAEADDVVCLLTPDPFMAVGLWFRDFVQVSDEEVTALLRASTSTGSVTGVNGRPAPE